MDQTPSKPINFANSFEATGSNQVAMRDRNERLVLTILRQKGPLPKAEIARQTGLSAQTVSVIMRALEGEGLLEKGERLRGKVGQPSVPMRLAPDGAFFLGLKVGWRSAELTLVNFIGEEIACIKEDYEHSAPKMILDFTRASIKKICENLTPENHNRIEGMGIAYPYYLWEWSHKNEEYASQMAEWKNFDLKNEIAKLCDYPVFMENDGTSACGAELTFGTAQTPQNFLYIYIGHFIGGGIVLNGALYKGQSGNAGAIGSFPNLTRNGPLGQIIDTASLYTLEQKNQESIKSSKVASLDENSTSQSHTIFENWLENAAPSLVHLIIGSCAVIDFPAVLIDGNMPSNLCERIVERIAQDVNNAATPGIQTPVVSQGTLGPSARRLGAASLPLSKKFMLEGRLA